MSTYNVEFCAQGEWYAQHTCIAGIQDATQKARALWRAKVEAGDKFSAVRVTKGLPFSGDEVKIYLCNSEADQ